MKLPSLPIRSLRANLVMGVVAMLLPWVMFVLVEGQLLFPRVIGAFHEAVQHTGANTQALMGLHALVQRAATAANDYVIQGDPAQRQNFMRLSGDAERAFEAFMDTDVGLPEQQELVRSAREAWRKTRDIAEALLVAAHATGEAAAVHDLQRLNAGIENTHELLDRIHGLVQRRATEQLAAASAVVGEVVFLIAVIFSMSMAMAAVSGFGLARAILVPLRTLEEGANRLGAGDLTHRVALEGRDELHQLAGAFNAMADRLQQSQAALEELSTRDGLTGLYNHREIDRRLDEEVGRQHRYGRPFSLLMLDLDHFKAVNDSHGHQIGDEVLRAVAARIQAELRPTDQVARYGGEEFMVILAETPGPGALAVAERIRAVVAARSIAFAGDLEIPITVSVGVAAFPEDAASGGGIVAAADKALYAAKAAGRNRVMPFGETPEARSETHPA
jgi:diguanylate cyclase (GGDEF)-like protein